MSIKYYLEYRGHGETRTLGGPYYSYKQAHQAARDLGKPPDYCRDYVCIVAKAGSAVLHKKEDTNLELGTILAQQPEVARMGINIIILLTLAFCGILWWVRRRK